MANATTANPIAQATTTGEVTVKEVLEKDTYRDDLARCRDFPQPDVRLRHVRRKYALGGAACTPKGDICAFVGGRPAKTDPMPSGLSTS